MRDVLTATAAPMNKPDLMYNWPCGEPFFVACGTQLDSGGIVMTGQPYEDWHVGAGALDLAAALARIAPTSTTSKKPKKPR